MRTLKTITAEELATRKGSKYDKIRGELYELTFRAEKYHSFPPAEDVKATQEMLTAFYEAALDLLAKYNLRADNTELEKVFYEIVDELAEEFGG